MSQFDVRAEQVIFPVKPSGQIFVDPISPRRNDIYVGITLIGGVDRIKPGRWSYYTSNGAASGYTKTRKAAVEKLTELYV